MEKRRLKLKVLERIEATAMTGAVVNVVGGAGGGCTSCACGGWLESTCTSSGANVDSIAVIGRGDGDTI